MTPIQMMHAAVRTALTEPSKDPGENAGSEYITLAQERWLDVEDGINTYRCAMNHAAIADIVTAAIQAKEPWSVPEPIGQWKSSVLTHEGFLRRFLPVSHWNEDRLLYEQRSWFCLGEVAHYRLPMQLIVAVIGHMSGGRRTGHFSKAMLHPQRSHLRFRRKKGQFSGGPGFKETWTPVYREDVDTISRERWLECMMQDDILQESIFVVNIPVPSDHTCQEIRELASVQLSRLRSLKDLPPRQLSTCFDPIAPCPFRYCCHAEPEQVPSAASGFLRL
jgi:hypothetical protein